MTAQVNSRISEFEERSEEWSLIRAFLKGASALKTIGFINAPKQWTREEKEELAEGAYLFNATNRTVGGFSGMLTAKPAVVDIDAKMQPIKDDATGDGRSIDALINICADELCGVGALGLLVDYPANVIAITQDQATQVGARPMVALYPIENVLEVNHVRIGGKSVLSRVRLLENVTISDGEWGYKTIQQVRVLDLFNGTYRQRVYQKTSDAKETWAQAGDDLFPVADGKKLTEIPFRLITADGNVKVPPRPPLHDLAEVNLMHLNDNAWYQRALRLLMPFFYALGMEEPEGGVRIGTGRFMFSGNENAKINVLQATKENCGALVEAMTQKRQDMAIIGARFLAEQSQSQQAEATALIHRSGDNASLSTISAAIEQGLTEVLMFCAKFMGIDYPVKVTLSRDYMPRRLSAQEMIAFMTLWQGGGITLADLYDNLVKGEIVQPRENGADDYKEELALEAPLDALPAGANA